METNEKEGFSKFNHPTRYFSLVTVNLPNINSQTVVMVLNFQVTLYVSSVMDVQLKFLFQNKKQSSK